MSLQNYVRKSVVIARNTFREAVRDRVLYNLIVFVLLITASAVLLGDLTDGHEARTIINLGLSAMLLFGAFISIFVGISLVSKEIEKKTVYAILAKPVNRGEFIIGKYFGLCLTLLINVIVMGIGVSLALLYVGGGNLSFSIWGAILLIYLELTIITAVAILFSSFSSPALSALITFLIFVAGHFSASLRDFAESLGSEAAKVIFNVLYYLLPNLSFFSFITNAAHGESPSFEYIGGAFIYALIYSSVVITASVMIFSKRNFK